jgi:hypothetical protein
MGRCALADHSGGFCRRYGDSIRMNHAMHKLWQLRQYLAKMRDAQTVLVRFDGLKGPECLAFGFTDEGYRLGDRFAELSYKPCISLAMAEMGLDPLKRGEVYAYIERRAPAFVPNYYGWGIER